MPPNNPSDQQDYDTIATQYDSIESLPHSKISQQLVSYALGDCKNLKILDLGGGTGLHARRAINAGAARVDNVDISPGMLRGCEVLEEKNGRGKGEKMGCFVGDVGRSLEEQGVGLEEGGYDVVLMIWTFDHAGSDGELGRMWGNTAKYCKMGGRVISIRSNDPRKRPEGSGKYGVKLHEIETVNNPEGVGIKYKFTVGLDEASKFTAVATNMEKNCDLDLSRKMARRYGFDDLVPVPVKEMQRVKEDPEFWQEFVESQGFLCVVGTKVS